MLLYVQRSSTTLPPVWLGKTVATELDVLRRTFPPDVRIDLKIPDVDILVAIQPSQVAQIIKNLICNVVHALAGNGKISVSVDEWRGAATMRLPSGHYQLISIADDGPGIPPAQTRPYL
jgi:signal transduction histidine kinase